MIYDKSNGDVARLEWVGDAFSDDANFGKSVKAEAELTVFGLVLTDHHIVHGKKSKFLKLKLWPKHCKNKIIQAMASIILERKACFSMC